MRPKVEPGMNAKDLEKLLKETLDSVPLAFIRRIANKSLRYMDAYRKGATGRLAAFANKKYTSHRCLPQSWLDECMAEYKAAFGEHVEDSMVDVASMGAQLDALSGLGRREGVESDDDDEEEASGDEGCEEAAEDEDEADDDEESSSEESDAAEEVAAAHHEAHADRSSHRDNAQIAVYEASARPASELTVQGGRPRRELNPVNYHERVQQQRYTSSYMY